MWERRRGEKEEKGGEGRREAARKERSGGEKLAAALLERDVRRRPVGRSGGCSDDLYARDGRSPSSGRSAASPATILHWGDLPQTPPPLRVRCRQWAGSGAGGETGRDGSGRDGAGHAGSCRRRRRLRLRQRGRRGRRRPRRPWLGLGPLPPGRAAGALRRAGPSHPTALFPRVPVRKLPKTSATCCWTLSHTVFKHWVDF